MTLTKVPDAESIRQFDLANGIQLFVYENFAVDLVTIEGLVPAGSLGETASEAGLAAFTAGMLLRGTAQRDFDSIYEGLEAVGAHLGFAAGRHTVGFGGDCLGEDVDLVLSLISEALRTPTFPVAQLEQVRGEILTGLLIRANDTGQQARLAFHEALYGRAHPYGRSSRGYPETIGALARQDLVSFHDRFYGPAGLVIVIVGAIESGRAFEKVQDALGGWQNASQQTLPPVPPATRPTGLKQVVVPMPDKRQVDVVLGLPGPLRSAPDYLDASLANTVLGVFGMMGRLGKRVREEQALAYYVYSQLQGSTGPLPWFVGTGVDPGRLAPALATIREEIRRIQTEPVPSAELADSQAYRSGSLPVSLETNEGIASVIADMVFLELGLDYLHHFPASIQAITPERLTAAANRYFSADDIVVALAGPVPPVNGAGVTI